MIWKSPAPNRGPEMLIAQMREVGEDYSFCTKEWSW